MCGVRPAICAFWRDPEHATKKFKIKASNTRQNSNRATLRTVDNVHIRQNKVQVQYICALGLMWKPIDRRNSPIVILRQQMSWFLSRKLKTYVCFQLQNTLRVNPEEISNFDTQMKLRLLVLSLWHNFLDDKLSEKLLR